jgi:predicted enzyme related to lactoylglutathione lyase
MDGVITWHELITSDVEAAVRFYTELLGLELETRTWATSSTRC